jgi:hypothetical protein
MGLWGEAFAVDKQSSAVEAMDKREGMVKRMKIYSYLCMISMWGMPTFLIHFGQSDCRSGSRLHAPQCR